MMKLFKRWLTATMLVLALVGGSMIAAAPAHAIGYFTNASGGGHYTIEVQSDYGQVLSLRPGQGARNIAYVIVRQGQCVYVQYRGTSCPARGSVWVWLGQDAGYAVRTR